MTTVTITTQTACATTRDGKQIGGYAAIMLTGRNQRELSGGFLETSPERLELTALRRALCVLKRPCTVVLRPSNMQIATALEADKLTHWARTGWKKPDGKAVANTALWRDIAQALAEHAVSVEWVAEATGDRVAERARELAREETLYEAQPTDIARAQRAAPAPVRNVTPPPSVSPHGLRTVP